MSPETTSALLLLCQSLRLRDPLRDRDRRLIRISDLPTDSLILRRTTFETCQQLKAARTRDLHRDGIWSVRIRHKRLGMSRGGPVKAVQDRLTPLLRTRRCCPSSSKL